MGVDVRLGQYFIVVDNINTDAGGMVSMINLQKRDVFKTLGLISTTRKSDQRMLIVTDPPYNNNTNYGNNHNDNMDVERFELFMIEFVNRSSDVMRDGDYLIIVINDRWQPELQLAMKTAGLHFRNHIIWYFTFGQNQKKRFTPSKAHILVYSKSKSPKFDWTRVSVPSWRSLNGDKRAGGRSRNPNKVMDDVWTDIPRLVWNNEEWMFYANQLPVDLCERIILPHVDEQSLIVDPFCGTGTFVKVAKNMNHDVLAGDINSEAIRISKLRLQNDDEVIHADEYLRYKSDKNRQ